MAISETFTGNDGDIQTQIGSVDQTGNYVFEAESHIEEWTISRTICYWTVFTDTNTMISIWNYKSAAQDFVLTLYYRNGRYELPIHLDSQASLELDIASLMKQRTPDLHGNVLPTNITEGSAMLSSISGKTKKMEVSVSSSYFNVRNGTCGQNCLTCNGITSFSVAPNSLDLGVQEKVQMQGVATYNTGETEYSTMGQWGSENTTIADIGSDGIVSGVSPGIVNIEDYLGSYQVGVGYACFGYNQSCPTQVFSAKAEVTVGSSTGCPTSIYRGSQDIVPTLSDYFPDVRSGVGLDADMRVLPAGSNREMVTETVSQTINSCNANTPGTQNVCVGSSRFMIGFAGGVDAVGISLPNIDDQFWDLHETRYYYSILSGTPQQSCTVQCLQQYSCGGNVVGQFTIQRMYSLGSINGNPVTNVSVTKH